jgi:anti-anti-sigma factor
VLTERHPIERDPTGSPTAGTPSLMCEVIPERETIRVRPIGCLDIATAPVLERQLSELRAAGFRHLLLDLAGLDFMDSAGLHLMLKWHTAAQRDGFEIAFSPGTPTVQRVFELTRTEDRLPFVSP